MQCLKCIGCGYEIDNDLITYRERHGFTDGRYEKVECCPRCGGAIGVAYACADCGRFFWEDELHHGRCRNCVADAADYGSMLQFLEENDLLVYFVFARQLESSEPEQCSDKLRGVCKEIFLRSKANDLITNGDGFLRFCQKFAVSGEMIEDFSEWLHEREVERCRDVSRKGKSAKV